MLFITLRILILQVETWIKEKKNKLRVILKDYNLLNADEKIKCLKKQQSIQAEIESHEPIIQRIIQVKSRYNNELCNFSFSSLNHLIASF